MKKLMLAFAVAAFSFGAGSAAFAVAPMGPGASGAVFAQEDCKEGETWNDETKKCEPASQ